MQGIGRGNGDSFNCRILAERFVIAVNVGYLVFLSQFVRVRRSGRSHCHDRHIIRNHSDSSRVAVCLELRFYNAYTDRTVFHKNSLSRK